MRAWLKGLMQRRPVINFERLDVSDGDVIILRIKDRITLKQFIKIKSLIKDSIGDRLQSKGIDLIIVHSSTEVTGIRGPKNIPNVPVPPKPAGQINSKEGWS